MASAPRFHLSPHAERRDPDPHHWPWSPPENPDFDCLDSFADPLLAAGTLPTHFGTAPEENRMGDQADLFRTFTYKPMRLIERWRGA